MYDVTEFEEYLSLKEMRKIDPNIQFSQYYSYIDEKSPLYQVIKEWDKAFSLDGNLCKNPYKVKKLILQNAKKRGK